MIYSLRYFLLWALTMIPLASGAVSLSNIDKFKNNKEVQITSFSKGQKNKILKKYEDQALREFIVALFRESLRDFINKDNQLCEMNLITRYIDNLTKYNLPAGKEDLKDYIKLLRSLHEIDDVFYELLVGITSDYFNLKELDTKRNSQGLVLGHVDLFYQNNVRELFADYMTGWPDEVNSCAYGQFMSLKSKVKDPKGEKSKDLNDLRVLNIKAFKAGVISLDTYHRFEYLRTKSFILKRDLWLEDYIEIILNAKDTMTPRNYKYEFKDIEKEFDFSSEKIKMFSSLTRRKILYSKYNPTQIILLSQVLQKASRRMGSDPDVISGAPVIVQEFEEMLEDGERRTYVERIELDPQSQYNLARRLLRKDILDLQVMDNFVKLKITFEDVVMAALETGYVSTEDVILVVKYDDLWNRETPKLQRIVSFIFRLVGYSTFFVPPPWNIPVAIALGITEGLVDNQFRSGADHDNPATFIE